MSLFITDAYASPVAQAVPDAPLGSMLMLVGFIVIFYLLLIRPQSKRAKAHRDLVQNLTTGDEVITNGGVLGTIAKLNEQFIVLSISDNLDIKIQKSAVTATLPKGTLSSI